MSDQEIVNTFKSVIGTMTNITQVLREVKEELDVFKAAVPQLVKDAKAAQKKRKYDRNYRRKTRQDTTQKEGENVVRQTESRTTKETEKAKDEISPHTPL